MDIRPSSDEELQELLSRQEDQFLDFKSKRIAPSKLQPHFVALANTDGGEVFVGVEDESLPANERIDGYLSLEEANEVVHHLLEKTSPMVPDVLDFRSFLVAACVA